MTRATKRCVEAPGGQLELVVSFNGVTVGSELGEVGGGEG